jgi:branched-chain amino acid transport system substrate-binding protein
MVPVLSAEMPIVMQRKKTFIGLLGLAVNSEFNYPDCFVMIPSGPEATAFIRGFFDVALTQNGRPQTVAIMGADQEFSRNAAAFGTRKRKRHARETGGVGPVCASPQLS